MSFAVFYELFRAAWRIQSPETVFFFPSVLAIGQSTALQLLDIQTWNIIATTTTRIGISFALALAAGSVLGSLLGVNKKLYLFVRPMWDFSRSIPPSVLFPLLVIVFGIGVLSKVLTAAITATLILSLSVADAVRSLDQQRLKFYRHAGMQEHKVLFFLILPEVFFRSWSAMRVVASLIVALILITEMFLGVRSGLGGQVIRFSETLQFEELFATIIIAGAVGFATNVFVEAIERRAARFEGAQ